MKTDTPTPETDAIIQQVTIDTEAGDSLPKYTAMLVQARKLERQRDALLGALDQMAKEATTAVEYCEWTRMRVIVRQSRELIATVKGERE